MSSLLCLQREKFTHQDAKQLLQVAADDVLILIERPAALLSIILVPGQICEDHFQPLLVMADLSRGQPRTQILHDSKTTGKWGPDS